MDGIRKKQTTINNRTPDHHARAHLQESPAQIPLPTLRRITAYLLCIVYIFILPPLTVLAGAAIIWHLHSNNPSPRVVDVQMLLVLLLAIYLIYGAPSTYVAKKRHSSRANIPNIKPPMDGIQRKQSKKTITHEMEARRVRPPADSEFAALLGSPTEGTRKNSTTSSKQKRGKLSA